MGEILLLSMFRALGRRWYVVVVGLLLTAGLVYGAFRATPPEYSARALVLLLPSETQVGEGGNPFLVLGGLEQPAGIVVAYFASAAAADEISDVSPTAEHLVAIDDSTRGPVIVVQVNDTTPEGALAVLDLLSERIPEELQRLQTDVSVPDEAIITSMTLTRDEEATEDRSGTVRVVIAAAAVGLVGTIFGAIALDGALLRRSSRRDPEAADEAVTAAEPPVEPARRRRGAKRPRRADADAPVAPDDAPAGDTPVEDDRPVEDGTLAEDGTPVGASDARSPAARQ